MQEDVPDLAGPRTSALPSVSGPYHGESSAHSLTPYSDARRTVAGNKLFLLHRLEVVAEVGNALLHLTFMPSAHTPENRSPHRHLFVTMCR